MNEDIERKREQRRNIRMVINNQGNSLYTMQNKIKDFDNVLENLDSEKMRACIKDRSKRSTADLQENYNRVVKEMGTPHSGKPLPVFCVAAKVFLDFNKEGLKHPGFRSKSCTQIPALSKWLVETTLEDRHRIAKSYLEEIDGLVRALAAWAKDTSPDLEIPAERREELDADLENKLKDFSEVCHVMDYQAVCLALPNHEV